MKTAWGTMMMMAALLQFAAAQDADKALWIDRHNYFRMTALPFAAGNMLRVKWSDELATQAQTDAAACAATGTGAGVNVAVVASAAGAVDAAFEQWVVAPALQAFPTLTAPKAAGEPVGVGVYNSYSQVVWSSTNQVGCAQAACSGGKVGVACRYAPAGNDGASPWYIHGPAGSACPEGTVSKVGLCVTSVDDPSYNDLAPIPAGANAYDVFKDFIPNMQKALEGEAVAVPTAGPTPDAAVDGNKVPEATTAAPGATTTKPAAASADGSDVGPLSDSAATTTPAATPPPSSGDSTSDGDGPASAPTVTKVVDGKVYVKVLPTTAPPTSDSSTSADANAAASNWTPAPTVTKVVGGKVYVKVLPPTSGPSDGTSTDPSVGDSTPAPTVTKVVDGKVYVKVLPPNSRSSDGTSIDPSVGDNTPAPTVTKVVSGTVYVKVDKDLESEEVGTVKPGSGTGSTFSNQASSSPASAASTSSSDTPSIGANNKSAGGPGEAKFSAAGIAGVIVIGCVAVAGVAVFISYRKNQQRQRDIMQNGGIHVL